MKGKMLTEGELKLLPTGSKVHLFYHHPDPSEARHNGPAWVEQSDGFCWFHIGGPNSSFCMDWTYGEDGRTDASLCESVGDDGDEFEIHVWVRKKKK